MFTAGMNLRKHRYFGFLYGVVEGAIQKIIVNQLLTVSGDFAEMLGLTCLAFLIHVELRISILSGSGFLYQR
jgi:hypothetical protein